METGRLVATQGQTLVISKGPDCRLGDVLHIKSEGREYQSVVTSFQNDEVSSKLLDLPHRLTLGDPVVNTGRPLTIPVGESVMGRCVDPFGRPLDEMGPIVTKREAELSPPLTFSLQHTRRPRDQQFITRVRAIDSLIPVAKNQQLLFLDEGGVGGETTLGMLARNSIADVVVVALIGPSPQEVCAFKRDYSEIFSKTVVVLAPTNAPNLQKQLCLDSAVAQAVGFAKEGKNVLLLVNSLTRWEQFGGDPARDLTNIISRLEFAGPGSVTGFFRYRKTETELTPEHLACFDGFLSLSKQIAHSCIYPAIDPMKSISRHQLDKDDDMDRFSAIDILYRYRKYLEGGSEAENDPIVKRAEEHFERLRAFLRQGIFEMAELSDTKKHLKELLA